MTSKIAEGKRLGQPLLAELLVDQRRSQQLALGRIPEGVRQADVSVKQAGCLARRH
jgi:hypothetical protein